VSLRLRLALFLAVLVVGVLTLQGVLGYASLERTLLRTVDKDLEQYLEVLTQQAVSAEDLEFLKGGRQDYTVRSRLVRGERVLASSGGPFPAALGGVEEVPRSRGDWRLASVALPKLGGDVRLEVALSSKNYVGTLNSYRNSTLLSAVLLSLCAALVAGGLARRALEPLSHFAHTAHRIAESGNLNERMPLGGGGELEELSKTLNHMLERLGAFRLRESEFTRHAAHELRTPLTALQLQLDAEGLGLYTSREVLEETRVQVMRMRSLTENLLALAQEGETALETVDGAGLCRQLCLRFSARYQGPYHLNVRANPVLLERALENLLENAGKYAPGEVQVTLEQGEAEVYIRVEDRGPGLRGDALHQASEAFYRAPGTRGPGSGLGLAVVSRIVGAHGGRLRLENRDGGGLGVVLELPKIASVPQPTASQPTKLKLLESSEVKADGDPASASRA